jgi:hypothetical protein
MSFSDARRCSASAKRSGERCKNAAVIGFGVCRYSSRLPERLAARYQEAQADPRLLELRDEIALVDARMSELLQRLEGSESGENWRRVQEATVSLDVAIRSKDAQMMEVALSDLRSYTRQGQADMHQWQEIQEVLDLRRKLVESERKRWVQQMITAERAMILLGAITSIIKEHVHDRTILAAISTGIRGLVSVDVGAESES